MGGYILSRCENAGVGQIASSSETGVADQTGGASIIRRFESGWTFRAVRDVVVII